MTTHARTQLVDGVALERIVARLAHEVREKHPRLDTVVLVAIRNGGVPVAERLAGVLAETTGQLPPSAVLDVRGYRDDGPRPRPRSATAFSGAAIDGAIVILIDDVLHTGRTLRCGLDALADQGRPAAVEPLVLIDRGHRELPLRATYVGRNLPIPQGAWVEVTWDGAHPGAFLVEPSA